MNARGANDHLLTAEFVRLMLSYDPDTGIVTWIKREHDSHVMPGTRAGMFVRNGSRTLKLKQKQHREHRVIWLYVTGSWPTETIDHVDGNPGNNCWSNLRLATASQQQMNRGCRCASGYKGVYEVPRGSDRWQARIRKNGRSHTIGTFRTKQDAHAAYLSEAIATHGNFMPSIERMVKC